MLDFHEVLKQVKTGEEEFFVRFVSDYIRFESNTDSITTWSSAEIPYPRTNPELPNEIARSVECVISTDETDKTLNMYLGDYQSDRDPMYWDVYLELLYVNNMQISYVIYCVNSVFT